LVSGWDNPAVIPKATKSVRGSGNIYRDFDVPDADVRQLKAILAAEIIKTLDKKGLTIRKRRASPGSMPEISPASVTRISGASASSASWR
jgi:hypothetical protein